MLCLISSGRTLRNRQFEVELLIGPTSRALGKEDMSLLSQ